MNPCQPIAAHEVIKQIDFAVEALREQGFNKPVQIGLGLMQMKALREFGYEQWQQGRAKRYPGGDQSQAPDYLEYEGIKLYCAALENSLVLEGIAT